MIYMAIRSRKTSYTVCVVDSYSSCSYKHSSMELLSVTMVASHFCEFLFFLRFAYYFQFKCWWILEVVEEKKKEAVIKEVIVTKGEKHLQTFNSKWMCEITSHHNIISNSVRKSGHLSHGGEPGQYRLVSISTEHCYKQSFNAIAI